MRNIVYARDANGQVMAIYEREFNPNLSNNPSGNTCFDMVLIWPTMGYECDIKVCEPFVTFNAETNTLEFSDVYNIECSDPYNNKIYYSIPEGTIIPIAPVITEYKGEYHQINRSNSWKAKYDLDLVVYDLGNNPVTLKLQQLSSSLTYADPTMLPKLAEWHVYGNEQQGRFMTKYPEQEPTYYGVVLTEDIRNNIFSRQLGKKSYELKDHLGNVRTTFSDIKMPTGSGLQPFRVDLLSKSEYYPYGMKINDLSYNATGASERYGYNGTHEQDKELNADGNYLDFGNFGYDTRVAMRRNQEPLRVKFPHLSGYSAFGSNPIMYSDLDGYLIRIMATDEAERIKILSYLEMMNATELGNEMITWAMESEIEVMVGFDNLPNPRNMARVEFTPLGNYPETEWKGIELNVIIDIEKHKSKGDLEIIGSFANEFSHVQDFCSSDNTEETYKAYQNSNKIYEYLENPFEIESFRVEDLVKNEYFQLINNNLSLKKPIVGLSDFEILPYANEDEAE